MKCVSHESLRKSPAGKVHLLIRPTNHSFTYFFSVQVPNLFIEFIMCYENLRHIRKQKHKLSFRAPWSNSNKRVRSKTDKLNVKSYFVLDFLSALINLNSPFLWLLASKQHLCMSKHFPFLVYTKNLLYSYLNQRVII